MEDGAESVSSLIVGNQFQYSMISQFRPVIDSPMNALHSGWYPNLYRALDGFQDWNVRMDVIVGYLNDVHTRSMMIYLREPSTKEVAMLETLRNNPSLSRIFFPIYLLSEFAVKPEAFASYPFEQISSHFPEVSERDLAEQKRPVYLEGGVLDRNIRARTFNACSPNTDDNKISNWFYHWLCCAGYVRPGVWPLPNLARMGFAPHTKRIDWDDEPDNPVSWPSWARVLTVSFCARVQKRRGDGEIHFPFVILHDHTVEFEDPPQDQR